MGIGRFGYTPILPIMQEATLFSDIFAGYLASSNFLGYLLGALLAGLMKWRGRRKSVALKVVLIINIATTIGMGLTSAPVLWLILRFVSGLTSGVVFVLASSIVMDAIAKTNRLSWSGIFYSGVGIGIFFTGLFVPLFHAQANWQGAWIGLGVLALLLSGVCILWLKEQGRGGGEEVFQGRGKGKRDPRLKWLILSYGCEGVGYIVIGTFIVAMLSGFPGFTNNPSLSWVVVGAAAIPSCIFWAKIAKVLGNIVTLQILFALQIVGVLLPVFVSNVMSGLLASILFGATFMGITTLFVSEVRAIAPSSSNRVIGYLTFVYGIGQMIGPSVAGFLIEVTGNYDFALYFSAAILLLGMLLLSVGKHGDGSCASGS